MAKPHFEHADHSKIQKHRSMLTEEARIDFNTGKTRNSMGQELVRILTGKYPRQERREQREFLGLRDKEAID